MFNALNQAGITDRNTTMNLANTTAAAAATITNLPVRRERQPDSVAVAAAQRRIRRRDRLPDRRAAVQVQIRFSF